MIVSLDGRTVDRLWRRFKDMEANVHYRGDGGKAYFSRALSDSVLVAEYPYGLLRFTDYWPPYVVRVHGLFDGKAVFGAREELWRLGRYVFATLDVQFIDAIVPAGRKSLGRLVRALGMSYARTLPRAMRSGTIYIDADVYRLRRNEICQAESMRT